MRRQKPQQLSTALKGGTYVKLFTHCSLIGNHGTAVWGVFVTSESEIDFLPYEPWLKKLHKRTLQFSKFGIAIVTSGNAVPINKMDQIIEAKILPPMPDLVLKMLEKGEQ